MGIDLFRKGIYNTLVFIISFSGGLVLYPTLSSFFAKISGSQTIVLYDMDWEKYLNHHPEDVEPNTDMETEK